MMANELSTPEHWLAWAEALARWPGQEDALDKRAWLLLERYVAADDPVLAAIAAAEEQLRELEPPHAEQQAQPADVVRPSRWGRVVRYGLVGLALAAGLLLISRAVQPPEPDVGIKGPGDLLQTGQVEIKDQTGERVALSLFNGINPRLDVPAGTELTLTYAHPDPDWKGYVWLRGADGQTTNLQGEAGFTQLDPAASFIVTTPGQLIVASTPLPPRGLIAQIGDGQASSVTAQVYFVVFEISGL